MRKELEKKISQAIKLLQSVELKQDDFAEVAFSGGKDSEVILQLVKESGIKYKAIYKNTTIDPPGTIKHCKSKGVEIANPETSFLKLLGKRGYPTRMARFCCEKLKEYTLGNYNVVIGVRKSESRARAERYNEPVICREYSKKKRSQIIMPILEWSDEDVEEFIKDRNIQCHPLYYDEHGNFHVERRLGCMCCPLQSKKKRLEEFKRWPNMVKLYLRGGAKIHGHAPRLQSQYGV